MKKINPAILKSRMVLKNENKKLLQENEELKRNINSKYWSSATVVLDHLFHTDHETYNKVHNIIFGKGFGETKSPTHEQIDKWKQKREKELLDKITELETMLKENKLDLTKI